MNAYEEKLTKQEAITAHNHAFIQRYTPMLKKWAVDNPNKQHPSFAKDKEGKYFWANRKLRRANGK